MMKKPSIQTISGLSILEQLKHMPKYIKGVIILPIIESSHSPTSLSLAVRRAKSPSVKSNNQKKANNTEPSMAENLKLRKKTKADIRPTAKERKAINSGFMLNLDNSRARGIEKNRQNLLLK